MAEMIESGPLPAGPRPVRQGWLWALVRLVTALLVIGLGIALALSLGYGMTTSAAQRIVAVTGLLVYLVVTVVSPFAGILLWLLLYPFAETTLNISLGGSIPDLSPTRLIVGFLACMLLAEVAIRKRPLPKLTSLDFWGLMFIAGIGLSAVFTPNLVASFKAVLDMFLMPLIFYYLTKHFVTSRRHIEWLFNLLLLIGAYSAVLAIHEQLTGVIWFSTQTYVLNDYAGGLHILRSLWGTNAVYGSIFALVIPIALYRMVQSRDLAVRLGYAVLSGVFLLSMFFTYKRAAWIAMLISFAILFVLYPAMRRLFIVMAIVFAIPLAVFWQRIIATSLVEERVTANAATLNGRTDRWQAAVALFEEKPIFGQGFSQFDTLSGFVAIENHYLNILVSGGLVAFIPFVVFWLLVLLEAIRLFIRGPSEPGVFVTRPIMAVFLAVIATYLVKGFTGIHTTAINLMFYVVVGAIVGSQAEARRRYALEAAAAASESQTLAPASPATWEPAV